MHNTTFLIRSNDVQNANVQVSLDSPDKDTLEWIRTRAKFEKVVGGAERIVHWRKKLGNTRLRINFHGAVMRQNLEQLPDLKLLVTTGARNAAIDVHIDDPASGIGPPARGSFRSGGPGQAGFHCSAG